MDDLLWLYFYGNSLQLVVWNLTGLGRNLLIVVCLAKIYH